MGNTIPNFGIKNYFGCEIFNGPIFVAIGGYWANGNMIFVTFAFNCYISPII